MKNPFNHENYPSNRIKRNSFPLSFQYNGTFEYGKIYPVGLIRVPNAGTYKIEPTLALNFMPTVFPVQTRQKAYLHFFYGRDRNFWNEYKDFVHGLKPNLVKPYLDESITQARTGNLLDYLGVPTTLVGAYGTTSESEVTTVEISVYSSLEMNIDYTDSGSADTVSSIQSLITDTINGSNISDLGRSVSAKSQNMIYFYPVDLVDDTISIELSYVFRVGNAQNNADLMTVPSVSPNVRPLPTDENYAGNYIYLVGVTSDGDMAVLNKASVLSATSISVEVPVAADYDSYFIAQLNTVGVYTTDGPQFVPWYAQPLSYSYKCIYGVTAVRDIDSTTSPYWRSNDLRGKDTIKLNAIPCRMYETIYNLYYRNPQNNPYILNGVPEYNIFTPTLDGGVDNNLYQLRYRNWADDFLTTATQTPQQGIAPLVGLTDRGATITLTNDDGSITRYKTTLDDDGNLTGIETTDSSEPILTQALVDAVTYGISIEDIRNVNKMQKWLELNLRKGYQYKDVIEARWGISISYNELNLPEFIGGFTQEVSMQAVTQTANIDDSVTGQLGWQAGRMYCAKDGREITHYCDEAGYIMVLLSVAPMPNYSQLLPKHWFTRDLLEEYQPEFNHIGFQPITYKEVCPVQAFQESTENNNVLEQTFGYQRPWYEYMSMPDEVHGQFRTTLKDYLINRVFDVKPELSESFLLVDPEQINDVFNVTESDDKILGAINYNIVAKLPISEYATATIE